MGDVQIISKMYTVTISWSMAAFMSSKLEPRIWSCDTGHIGIHGGVDVSMVAW